MELPTARINLPQVENPCLAVVPLMPDRLDILPDADNGKVLAVVVGYYHQCLKNTPDALDYLHRRGVTHPHAIDHFRLGFSDRSLGLKLPPKQVKAGEAVRTRLQELGIYRRSGHEHFRGSITFPIMSADGSGQVADIYGRKILDGHLRKGTELHTYLTAERRGVWNVESFGPANEVVVCPSVFDALSFWSNGYRNATCTFSPTDLPPHLIPALVEFDISRVLVASEPLAENLLAAGLETFLIRLPPSMDVNTYARQTSDPADALGSLLRHAEWLGKGNPPSVPVTAFTPVLDAQDRLLDELLDNDQDEDTEPDDHDDAVESYEPDENESAVEAAPPVRLASPVPEPPPPDDVTATDAEVVLTFGSRRYRVRGFDKNATPDVLRVNLLAGNGVGMFIDTFDLYSHKHRKAFVEQAAVEMNVENGTVKKDVGRVLLKLEELQDARLATERKHEPTHPEMTADERDEALRLLRDPALLDKIAADFRVVGERPNLLVAYLAAVSRKLDQPLAVLVQSTSAAGKTTLMEAVLDMVPPEDVVKFSAMTGQSLYYMPPDALKHKILAVAEEAGAQRASYALKLLTSEGELRIASTGKEGSTGRLTTQEYRVEGPTMLFLTTTSSTVDEELQNRCVVLTVAEDRDQTKAIHQLQRRMQTLDGMLAAKDHQHVLALHRNAQRLLRPLPVVNPLAERLTFPTTSTRTRRDHAKYLTLIKAVTLLHQHQRPVRTVEHHGKAVEFIEATPDDIERANQLAGDVLGRCLDDLPPQTRALLALLDAFVAESCQRDNIDRPDFRFSRRQVRDHTGWGDTQLKVHLGRLVELEYVVMTRNREARRHVYELLYTTGDGHTALPGLLDVAELRGERSGYDGHRSGQNGHRSGHGRGSVGPRSGGGRGRENAANGLETNSEPSSGDEKPENVNTP